MEALDRGVLHVSARAQVNEPGAGFLVEMSTCLGHAGGDSSNAHRFVCVAARAVLTPLSRSTPGPIGRRGLVRNGPLGDT